MDQIDIYDLAAKEFRKITMAGRVVTVKDVKRIILKVKAADQQYENPKNAA